MVGADVVDDDECVEVNGFVSEQLGGFHDFVKGAIAGGVLTVVVVDVLRAVEADADEDSVFSEKGCPVTVDEDAVGLEGVGNGLTSDAVFFLEVDGSFKEVDACQCGLAALPRKGGVLPSVVHDLLDHVFEDVVWHEGDLASGREPLVEAVSTVKVAGGRDGFDEQ